MTTYRPARGPRDQQGAALLILLTIIVTAAAYTLLNRLNREPAAILRAAGDSKLLGEAKSALTGYALSASTPVTQPGRLPCPDYAGDGNFDGLSDPCDEQTNFVRLGRLPWQTLGLAPLRDSAGELLWYSPALELDGNQIINSDSSTSLRLDGEPREVAAVVIAPGAALEGQARPAGLAAQSDPRRYLEDRNSRADREFVSAATSAVTPFNDQLAVIYRDELLQAVERRVLGELKSRLLSYYAANRYYPYPTALNGTDCDLTGTQGHLPLVIKPGCPVLAEWTPASAPPAWFSSQKWNLLVWYAPAPACVLLTPDCSGSGKIQVRNTPVPDDDKEAVLLAAGAALSGQSRPALSLGDLLDDSENKNNDTVFSRLPVDAASNDQVQVVAP